ncbi:MAG: ABC transporter permease [bacterium]|nr:ABC transporter permease [bacterium]
MFYELSQLAVGNLLRARARLIMTSGGVLVGTSAVILLLALTFGLQRAAEASIGSSTALTDMQVFADGPVFGPNGQVSDEDDERPKLDLETISAFYQIPGVALVIPTVMLQGQGPLMVDELQGYASIMGIDPALIPYLGIEAEVGGLALERGQALAGAFTGDYFNDSEASGENFEPIAVNLYEQPPSLEIYPTSGEGGNNREIDLNITGVLLEGTSFDYTILMHIQDVIALNEWSTGNRFDPDTFVYDQVTVRASGRETAADVAQAIRDLGFNVGDMGEYLKQLNGYFNAMRLILGGVGGVALLVAAFGVANTMTMAILERTKEIGLMKAIGATDRDVLTVFLIEAGLVGFFGGVAGIATSLFLQNVINRAVANMPQDGGGGVAFLPINPAQLGGNLIVIPPELMLFAVLLATGVGVGAGLYPALRAANLTPVIALKQE